LHHTKGYASCIGDAIKIKAYAMVVELHIDYVIICDTFMWI
jgi:hypothetical protein